MKKANALELRQRMGKIVGHLLKTGEPVLIEKGRKPVAVLITLEDYQTRFVDREADELRKAILLEIHQQEKLRLPKGKTSLQLIRELRS